MAEELEKVGQVMPLPRGTYNETYTYHRLDLVTYNEMAYICKKLSVNNTPEADSEYWALYGASIPIDNKTILFDEEKREAYVPVATKMDHGLVLPVDTYEIADEGRVPGLVASMNAVHGLYVHTHEYVEAVKTSLLEAINPLKGYSTFAADIPSALDSRYVMRFAWNFNARRGIETLNMKGTVTTADRLSWDLGALHMSFQNPVIEVTAPVYVQLPDDHYHMGVGKLRIGTNGIVYLDEYSLNGLDPSVQPSVLKVNACITFMTN